MSRGYGKVQRAIIKVLTEQTQAVLAYGPMLAQLVYDLPEWAIQEKHTSAMNRALRGLRPWLEQNGWVIEDETLKKMGVEKVTRNQRLATGRGKKLRHQGRFWTQMKGVADDRRAREHAVIDAMGDNQRVAHIFDEKERQARDAEATIKMKVLMAISEHLDEYPIGERDITKVLLAIGHAHFDNRRRIQDEAQKQVDESNARLASRAANSPPPT